MAARFCFAVRTRLYFLGFFLLLAATSPLFARAAQSSSQQDTPLQLRASLLQGKVLDSTRAAITGARITVTPEVPSSGRLSRSAISSQLGEFSIPLEPGRYTIEISAPGFLEDSQSVAIPNWATPSREFILRVAEVRTAITVTDTGTPQLSAISTATKTLTPLRDVPQSITVVSQEMIEDQAMSSMADVVRYVPGITAIQGENNRDQLVIRSNSTSADFFLNGVRDDVQYYRDLYNVERIEALNGPNAMIFGRGGGGGVINRVSKEAGFIPRREFSLQGGSYGNKRFTADWDQPFSGSLNSKVALRLNAMYENSGSFRQYVNLQRYGVNPSLTILPAQNTKITIGYEHFSDHRIADRGIPSFLGRPADAPISTYFGDPDNSAVRARVDLGSVTVEHQLGRLNIRNRVLFGGYDRGYQNYVPGAANAGKSQVMLTAYNNATSRRNLFNQTDFTFTLSAWRIRHTLLGGAEFGRQVTDNFRNTGFFNDATTSIFVPYNNPTINTPVVFRQSATDADNHLIANVEAAYVQDQIELSRYIQIVAGLRFDRFDLRYSNNRNGDNLRRTDNFVSPRIGVVFKPLTPLSIYGNYSVSYLPSSGDQFSSLTAITQQVKPEKFTNYEVGAKWDISRSLALTMAGYRMDRLNTRSTDPSDPTRIVQTGSTRSNGYEIGLNGRVTRNWKLAGGYAFQDAYIRTATTAASAGARLAQVPRHTFSLWNNYQFISRLGAGLGLIHRTGMFAAVDNTVTLPGYWRVDAVLFLNLTERVRLQANAENVLNTKYYANADGNNNISPGSPTTLRFSLIGRF